MNDKLPSVTKVAFKAGLGAYMGFQCAKFCDEIITSTLRPFADKLVNRLTNKMTEAVSARKSI